MNETREPELIPIPSPKKTETSATPPQKGNCYEAAYETVQGLRSTQEKGGDPSLQNAQLFLVHGSVVSGSRACCWKTNHHAWVEIAWPSTRVVFELANGKQEVRKRGCGQKNFRPRRKCATSPRRPGPRRVLLIAHITVLGIGTRFRLVTPEASASAALIASRK